MGANPLLKRLGLSDTDRVAVLHADDIGMCQASVEAFTHLDEFGLVACGAVMVPCPWFPEAAGYARAHPQADLGVHLTLTSEWARYRWGPISTRDPASGLMDSEGFFPRRNDELHAHADPEAGRLELETQIQRALALGIDVSHIDTHMGTVLHPKFVQSYIELALKYRIPAMVFRWDEAMLRQRGLDAETAAVMARTIQALEANGFPLLDGMAGLDLGKPQGRLEHAKQVFDSLPAGVTHTIIHPSADTPELRAIANDWQARVADYQTFMSEEMRRYVHDSGVTVIGYRALRDLMRG
jgi:chitin disaccharide deacetylase